MLPARPASVRVTLAHVSLFVTDSPQNVKRRNTAEQNPTQSAESVVEYSDDPKIRSSRGEQDAPDVAIVVRLDDGHGVNRSSSFPEPLLRYLPSVQAGVFSLNAFDLHSQAEERRERTQEPCGDLVFAAKMVEIPGPEHHVISRPESETVKTT